jgi:hypothetical protein
VNSLECGVTHRYLTFYTDLNSTTTITTLSILPKHITRDQVLSFLQDGERMIHMNPIVKSVKRLPNESSIAFYKSVPEEHKPVPVDGEERIIPVYEVVEDVSGESPEAQAGNWRGGWAKRFIPDSIQYETSIEATEYGMKSLTHAAMGVTSVTKWVVKDAEDGGGLVVEKIGSVTSNRMLMSFIRTTLQEGHDKLAVDFVAALEKHVASLEGAEKAS